MISKNLMYILLVEYVIIAGVCLFEKQYNKFIYWIGASVIQYAVVNM